MHDLSFSSLTARSLTWSDATRDAINSWLEATSDYTAHTQKMYPILKDIFNGADVEPFTVLPLFLLLFSKKEMPQLLKTWAKYDELAPLEGRLNKIKASLDAMSRARDDLSLEQMHKVVHFWINRVPSGHMYSIDRPIRKSWVDCQILLADMAQYCAKAVTTDGYGPAPKRWAHNAGQALNKMDRSLSIEHIAVCFESALTQKTKRRLAKHLHPEIWLHPGVYVFLEPLLPKALKERYETLPWHNRSPAINKNLVALYCQEIEPFLESLGGDDIWNDRARIFSMINASVRPKFEVENALFEGPLSF